jgi:hypothetical protein
MRSGEPDAAKQAETILYRVLECYKNGDTTARPDTVTFNAVIDAWENTIERGAAAQAERILQFMHKQRTRMKDTFTSNLMLIPT